MTLRRTITSAFVLCLSLSACGPAAPPSAPATTAAAAAPAAPVITDAAGLRAKVDSAMRDQRIYAPAGDNAIEYYLALRRQVPKDAALATALLELLPYALIGSEQAVAREDFVEARRLLDLVEQADPQSPALPRLRDTLVTAESDVAQRLIAEAEQAKLMEMQQAQAEQAAADAAEAATRLRLANAAAPTAPSPAPPTVAPAPAPTRQPPAATSPTAQLTVPAAAVARPQAPLAASAAAMPRLISAPTPRYPLMAQRRKIEGEVTIGFTIQPDGRVVAPRVITATPPGMFEEAALVAAKYWRFEPTLASIETSRIVRFRLDAAQQR